MVMSSIILILSLITYATFAAHFRGGAISWRPATNEKSVLNSLRTIIIDQRYAWSKVAAASACTSSTILSFGLIGETVVSAIKCLSPTSTCNNAQYPSNVSTYVPCTDYNNILGMSYGYSSTPVNLTVLSSGLVLGYVASGAWLALQLSGSGGWSMIIYMNMSPRSDNQLINSSPTSDIPSVNYVPAGLSFTTSIDIPMNDADGDIIQCRFAQSSNTLGGVSVNECGMACEPSALPSSTQLISNNNTCTLIVSLPSIGYYAVTIQLEDFMENSTAALSSVPLQFLLLAYDTSNPTSTCTLAPIIKSIPPNLPLPGDTVPVQVTVLYIAMVIAQTGCENDTDTTITNFITSSPPGMLKTNPPFALASPSYAINLTWTPNIDQLGQTYTFCAIAIDSNYYSSNQYCFNFFVVPQTTTTTTTTTTSTSTSATSSTSTTSTTSITTTSSTSATTTSTTSATTTTTTTTAATTLSTTAYNYAPLVTGLSLGLGLPLLLLLSLLALLYLCRWCPKPLRTVIRNRFLRQPNMYCPHCRQSILFDDPQDPNQSKIPEGTRQYRQQYINNQSDDLISKSRTSDTENRFLNEPFVSRSFTPFDFGLSTTSLASPSTTNLIPMENISHTSSQRSLSLTPVWHNNSILVRAYSRQIQPI